MGMRINVNHLLIDELSCRSQHFYVVRRRPGGPKFVEDGATGGATVRVVLPRSRRNPHEPFNAYYNRHYQDPSIQKGPPCHPYTQDLPCKAWKLADRHYARHVEPMLDFWRESITSNHVSTYDAWMMEAIPHLLRGLWCPPTPPEPAGWPCRVLNKRVDESLDDQALRAWCEPHYRSRFWGLHFAMFRTAETYYLGPDPFDDGPDPKDVRLHLDYETRYTFEVHNCLLWKEQVPPYHRMRNANVGYGKLSYYNQSPLKGESGILAWQPTTSDFYWPIWTMWKPNYMMLSYAPPVYDTVGKVSEYKPWTKKQVDIWWLTNANRFKVWPQFYPSKKADKTYTLEPWHKTVQRKNYIVAGKHLNPDLCHYKPL